MKTSLLVLLLPVAALAGPSASNSGPTLAVATFQSDSATSSALGTHDAGVAVSRILSNDLAALSPISVVDSDDTGSVAKNTPATLVTGRVSMEGTDTVLTARVVPSGLGQARETRVRTEKSTSFADAVSLLAQQVGQIALSQQGTESAAWAPAQIVGTARPATLFTFQEVASVMSIDGIAIADETQTWDKQRPVLPGLHTVFVRYYDGTATAGHNFTLYAQPGVHYAARYERLSGKSPTLWISDESTGKAVTAMVEASVGDPARVIQGKVDSNARGMWSESNNPTGFRKVADSK